MFPTELSLTPPIILQTAASILLQNKRGLRSTLQVAWLAKCYRNLESLPREVHATQTACCFLLSLPCLEGAQCYQHQLINPANLTKAKPTVQQTTVIRTEQFLHTHAISVPDLWKAKGKKGHGLRLYSHSHYLKISTCR